MSAQLFIIRSGAGYFHRFHDDTPQMTTDPISAMRMIELFAQGTAKHLVELGYAAEIIPVEIGKFSFPQGAAQ